MPTFKAQQTPNRQAQVVPHPPSLPCRVCLALLSGPKTRCPMTVHRGGGKLVPGGIMETECPPQESQSPEDSERPVSLPRQRRPLCAGLRKQRMKAISNKHLEASIQKITKSWPFIPLNASHCDENTHLTETALGPRSPWPLSLFFPLPLRAQNVMIHFSAARGRSELRP